MSQLVIEDELAERLRAIAQRENRAVEEVLASMVEHYTARTAAFSALEGAFDDDVTDLSTTVRDTMNDFYRRKHGRTD